LPTKTALAPGARRVSIVRVPDTARTLTFAQAVHRGLQDRPKSLPCQYFYDTAGSRLFERICVLPEYYLTRTEDAILRHHAAEILAGFDQPPALIELGSGSSAKTERLIAQAHALYGDLHYFPIDVSPTILEESAHGLVRRFPRLRVTGYAADYRDAVRELAAHIEGPKCLLFLGSSLGNYTPGDAVALLRGLAAAMVPDDLLILGTDLVKDPAILEAAYNDSQGITARFNLNLLARTNRDLGADFDLSKFAHRALYRPDLARIEMHLESLRDQQVQIPGAQLVARFTAGEWVHTENSHKYTPEALAALAQRSGFFEEAAWTDRENRFRVQRWRVGSGRG
jgi:L-histidine Nalpha-methyltransferase